MWNVIITYDYGVPAIPKGYMCVNGGHPKCNHRVVGQASTQQEGLAIGKDIFDQEIEALAWLIHDPVLKAADDEAMSKRLQLERWFDEVKDEFDGKLRAIDSEHGKKTEARRAALMKERGLG